MVETHTSKSVYAYPHTWFCGVDGSDSADNAYSIVKDYLFREQCDRIVVGHVRDAKKVYLSWHFKPDYITEIYETKLMDIGKKGEYAIVDKDEFKTTKEVLWDLAIERKATIICTAMNGRKGPKE